LTLFVDARRVCERPDDDGPGRVERRRWMHTGIRRKSHRLIPSRRTNTVTASPSVPNVQPHSGPDSAASFAIAVVASIAVVGLLVASATFLGLAIAFPIAVPVAERFHVYVSPADVALAQQFAGVWWVFALASVASVAAAVLVAVKAVERLSPGSRS
jgi:uncharacterized oligopeptide transporter (OPT) family protein